MGANNGWLYNNSAAPQTFTTTTNSINLTPAPGATSVSNVGVTVLINGTPSTVLSSAVTFSNPVFTVGGPNEFCTSAPYGLAPAVPAGSTVNWITSTPSIISINSRGVATRVGNANGVAGVSATVTVPGCSFAVIPKGVLVGAVTPTGISFENENPLCINERYPRGVKVATVTNPIAGAAYEWSVNNIVRGSDENIINIIHSWCIEGTNTVSVRVYLCDSWSAPFVRTFEAEYCPPEGGGFRAYTILPNPAKNSIRVESKTENKILEIRIKDRLGNVKLLRKSSTKSKMELIDISTLPRGIYFVEIFDGKKWTTEKLIKE